MPTTKFDICNRALGRIGVGAITSFDDGTAQSDVAGREYELTILAELSVYPWRFATREAYLTKLAEEPKDRWSFYYQLPGDLIALDTVTHGGAPIVYDTYGDKVACDIDASGELVAHYRLRPDESSWPYFFIDAVTVKLASILAYGVARDHDFARALRKDFDDKELPAARLADSRQQSTRRIARSRLTGVRR